jgi:hypothetical protein
MENLGKYWNTLTEGNVTVYRVEVISGGGGGAYAAKEVWGRPYEVTSTGPRLFYYICTTLVRGKLQWRCPVAGIPHLYAIRLNLLVVVRVPLEARFFSSPQRPDGLWGTVGLLSNGCTRDFPMGIKRLQREADHWPPTSAEFMA